MSGDERSLTGAARAGRGRADALQDDPRPPFLITLKAGGAGLNLKPADRVIHVAPRPDPAVGPQAADRTHRTGRQKPPLIHKLIVRDPAGGRMLEPRQRRRQPVTHLIATEKSFRKSLTDDDVAAPFS